MSHDDIAALAKAVRLLLGSHPVCNINAVPAATLAAFDIADHAALADALSWLRVAGIVKECIGAQALHVGASSEIRLEGVEGWLMRKLGVELAPVGPREAAFDRLHAEHFRGGKSHAPHPERGNSILRFAAMLSGEERHRKAGEEITEEQRRETHEWAGAIVDVLTSGGPAATEAWKGTKAPVAANRAPALPLISAPAAEAIPTSWQVRELREQLERVRGDRNYIQTLHNDVRKALGLVDGDDIIEGAKSVRARADGAIEGADAGDEHRFALRALDRVRELLGVGKKSSAVDAVLTRLARDAGDRDAARSDLATWKARALAAESKLATLAATSEEG